MHIFLDSNIFFNNWKLNNPNFQYLFNFINNSYHSLLLSKLVVEETENNRRKQIDKTNSDLKKLIKDYNKLSNDLLDIKTHHLKNEDYDFCGLINDKTDN